MSRLAMQIDGPRLVLAGRMDDATALDAVQLPAGGIVVDTSGVTFVSSYGMREWLRFVRRMRGQGPVILDRVADMLMAHMNLIGEFAKLVTITSFYTQYECASCGAESAGLVEVQTHADALRAMQLPKFACPECGAAMTAADLPERYLTIFRA